MRRRTVIKGAGAATGAAVVGGGSASLDGGPVGEARAILPLLGVAAGGAAVGYLTKKAADKYLGDERDYSGYTGADALHNEIVTGANEMKLADEKVMTSISNNVTNSANVALTKGKAAIIEKMNAGATESDANTAMQEAIDGYYATIQRNLIKHFETQLDQVAHHLVQVHEHADLTYQHEGRRVKDDGTKDWRQAGDNETGKALSQGHYGSPPAYGSGSVIESTEETLLDGSTISYAHGQMYFESSSGSKNGSYFAVTSQHSDKSFFQGSDRYGEVRVTDNNGGYVKYFDVSNYEAVWDALITERDSVNSNLSGFVTDVYNNYSSGDIPTEDLVDPITASTELRQNYEGYQAQGAHAAMLGIPTSAEQSVDMTIQASDGDKNVVADIFTNYVPTDGSGTEVGFKSGTTYSPSGWSEPLYIAYEYTSDGETASEFTQIESDFTINSITNTDSGEALTEFSPTNQNNQTADVSTLKEELAQVREENIRLQEEAEESTGGAGGGFFDGGGNRTTLLAVGGAALALVFGLGGRE